MKITQVLVESAGATVAFAFGRFNPAHQGHIEVWRAVEDAGANWFVGTNPSTLGPNDPLTFEQKSAWMEEIYPPISGHIVPQTTVLSLAAYIFKKLRKNENATVAYITDDTDWAWSGKLLNQYNGVEGSHGYYKFAEIVHVPSPRVSSATALRDAARADDKVAFYHASGTDPKSKVAGLTYFDTVKQACEKYPLPVKKAKKVKESILNELNYTKPEVQQSAKTGKFFAWVIDNKGEKVVRVGDTAEEALQKLNSEVLDAHNAKINKINKISGDSNYSVWITGDVARNKAGIDKSISEIWIKLEPEIFSISTLPMNGFKKARGGSLHKLGGFNFNVRGSELEQLGLKPSNRYELSVINQSKDLSISKFKIAHHSSYYGSEDKLPGGTNSLPLMVIQQTGRNSAVESIEDEEAGEVKKQGQLIPWPAGTTKVHVSDVYDWYKLGMVISDLDDADPKMFGQGAPQTVIAFGSEEEESKLLPLLKRLGLRVDDIDPEGADLDEAYHAGALYEYLKKATKQSVAEANPNQQFALWHPETKSYKGSINKIPTSDYAGDNDITTNYRKVDNFKHSEVNPLHKGDDSIEKAERNVNREQLTKLVKAAFNILTPEEKEVLNYRFWHDMTLDSIAQKMSISGSRVRQIEAQAFRKLKKSSNLTPVGESTEQKTVAKTWDQMTAQEKSSGVKGRTVWNEKTKKYYTVFDVPAKQTTDEASLSTMRDYFAGDEEARDPYEITKQRLHFSKDKNAKATVMKKFRSQAEYEDWLMQNHLKHITPIKEDENINVSFDEAFNIINK